MESAEELGAGRVCQASPIRPRYGLVQSCSSTQTKSTSSSKNPNPFTRQVLIPQAPASTQLHQISDSNSSKRQSQCSSPLPLARGPLSAPSFPLASPQLCSFSGEIFLPTPSMMLLSLVWNFYMRDFVWRKNMPLIAFRWWSRWLRRCDQGRTGGFEGEQFNLPRRIFSTDSRHSDCLYREAWISRRNLLERWMYSLEIAPQQLAHLSPDSP